LLFEVSCNKKVFIKLLTFVFQSHIAALGGGLKTMPLGFASLQDVLLYPILIMNKKRKSGENS
jgi:hypothetical protein